MGSLLVAGLAVGSIALIDDSTAIPEDLKPDLVSAVEENVQFLSDEELQAALEGVPPDLAEEILRINEIARIKGIRTTLLGLVIVTIFGIIISIFLPPEILVPKKE